MEQTDSIVLLFRLFVMLALLLWFGRDFRGGRPPTPMHPSPTDDAALLRERRSSTQDRSSDYNFSTSPFSSPPPPLRRRDFLSCLRAHSALAWLGRLNALSGARAIQ